ncbi:hypothetical protein CROQUDRAFT_88602 [Cronartium quercuum f. sp. fusiforme G11]|uniref:Uncharacterized protein n=1 Tax=Cronartium quercuum f. sp. fusiforme G11 TaxID=708437 RepID=A0A9P6TFS5_9BASI|nr:hypothetical protein CROQUDRAFT_88602 [Cronartium quercuum f. sp. fusiforme G11]
MSGTCKIGTGKTAVINAIQKHAAHLDKCVNACQDHLSAFCQQFPNRPAYPPNIEYTQLLKMLPDDLFWNEGLFTGVGSRTPIYMHFLKEKFINLLIFSS